VLSGRIAIRLILFEDAAMKSKLMSALFFLLLSLSTLSLQILSESHPASGNLQPVDNNNTGDTAETPDEHFPHRTEPRSTAARKPRAA
jgi:hypothetical protein